MYSVYYSNTEYYLISYTEFYICIVLYYKYVLSLTLRDSRYISFDLIGLFGNIFRNRCEM